MNTIKLITVILILVIGVSIVFPEKSGEFGNKIFEAVNNILGRFSTSTIQTENDSTNSLKEYLNNLPETSEVNDEKIEEAKKIIYASPLRDTSSNISALDVVLTESGVVSWTNRARLMSNISELKVNIALNLAAKSKLQDMFAKQYFDHISPSGIGPAEVIKNSGYEYILVGENLAMGNFKTDQDLLSSWMNSSGHRANILNARFTEIGVAVQKGYYEGKELWMAVQEFGLPLSSCPSPNANTKNKIELNENYLKDLSEELKRRKEEISSTPKNNQNYNELVDAYNERVSAYNKLIEETRKIIGIYNNEVNAFNECLVGYN